MDSPSDEVKQVLARIKRGDQAAASELFDRYKVKLSKLINNLFAEADTRVRNKFEPEDVSQSVWRTFFRRHQAGEYQFQHWDALWSLLSFIVKCKFNNVCNYFRWQKRDPRMELRFVGPSDKATASWHALARDPSPEEAAAVKEQLEMLLARLSERQRKTLELHMEPPADGKKETRDQHYRRIADAMRVSVATVRRWLSDIREHLESVS